MQNVNKQAVPAPPASNLPPDDFRRQFASARADSVENARHVGLVRDTYTILEVGVPVAARTTAPPRLDEAAQAAFRAKAQALAPNYRTELLPLA